MRDATSWTASRTSCVVRTGCAWRQLPADFPPWESVYAYFAAWTKDGTLARLHNALRDQVRAADERAASSSAGVVDAQAVKGPTLLER